MFIAKKVLPVAVASLIATGATAEESYFVSGVLSQTSSNYAKSSRGYAEMPDLNVDRIIRHSSGWGLRAGVDEGSSRHYITYNYVSDRYGRDAKIREQNLSGSYDFMFPVADSTRLFAGASLGMTRLHQKTSSFKNDSDWGLHAGLQAGVVQRLGQNMDIEGGYRYTRYDRPDVSFKNQDGNQGKAKLRSSDQLYIALNWRF
jgi:opacity protein-like surface antigen